MSAINIAMKQSLNGQHKQHRVGAVIVKGGAVLSTGYNKMRFTRELQRPTLHAEADAILKVLKEGRQASLVGAVLYVSRYTKGGKVGLAKPCSSCMELIRSVGISCVNYTNDDGSTTRMKV